jgi:subtilisin family serine protease
MKKLPVILFLFCFSFAMRAQDAYWIFFADKKECTFNPETYFAPEALERRALHGLPASDYTDYPVNEHYLAQVTAAATETGYASRWFNAVEVTATPEQLQTIRTLPFVKDVMPAVQFRWEACSQKATADTMPKRTAEKQVKILQGERFLERGLTGRGVTVAILDVGFVGYKTNPAFAELQRNGQIKLTYDFVSKDENVDAGDTHGTEVLSCMAGTSDFTNLGMATGANYLLARIAKPMGNQQLAESRWMAAMEWADKNGAHIINNSGGPNTRSYFPEQMDGKTCLISRAGNMAARKGILVVSAAGNEGEYGEPRILPPSDADSVLCVGAAERLRGNCLRSTFSSYGPTADLRAKPDVCAPGDVQTAGGSSDSGEDEGTSFSSPLVAGFAACVLELQPTTTCMELFAALKKSGSLYPYFDYYHGTGFPQASYFLDSVKTAPPATLFKMESDAFTVWAQFDNPALSEEEPASTGLLYYAIEDANGRLAEYHIVDVLNKKITVANRRDYNSDYKVKLFYKGQYAEMVL